MVINRGCAYVTSGSGVCVCVCEQEILKNRFTSASNHTQNDLFFTYIPLSFKIIKEKTKNKRSHVVLICRATVAKSFLTYVILANFFLLLCFFLTNFDTFFKLKSNVKKHFTLKL